MADRRGNVVEADIARFWVEDQSETRVLCDKMSEALGIRESSVDAPRQAKRPVTFPVQP